MTQTPEADESRETSLFSDIHSNRFRQYLIELADEVGDDRKRPPRIEDHMLITVHPDDRDASITIKATAKYRGVLSTPTIKLAVVRICPKWGARYVMYAPDEDYANPVYLDKTDRIVEKALQRCNDAVARETWPKALKVRAHYPALRALQPDTRSTRREEQRDDLDTSDTKGVFTRLLNLIHVARENGA